MHYILNVRVDVLCRGEGGHDGGTSYYITPKPYPRPCQGMVDVWDSAPSYMNQLSSQDSSHSLLSVASPSACLSPCHFLSPYIGIQERGKLPSALSMHERNEHQLPRAGAGPWSLYSAMFHS